MVTLLIVSVVFAGCGSTREERQEANQNIKNVDVGMTQDRVMAVMGKPDDRQVFKSKYGDDVTLYYADWQLTFEDGKLDRMNRW